MDTEHFGELVWHTRGQSTVLNFVPPRHGVKNQGRTRMPVLRMGSMQIEPLLSKSGLQVVYTHPIYITFQNNHWKSESVFGILAGQGQGDFSGSKANFRDIINVAREQGRLIYVVSPANVSRQTVWQGWVRLGFQRWVQVPCPRPEAMYNRVPTRNAERNAAVISAKRILRSMGIPLFNPEYFNKKVIYSVLERSAANRYLPESVHLNGGPVVQSMVARHGSVYLKPTGGSIGHGILRVDAIGSNKYRLSVLKNSRCTNYEATGFANCWALIRRHRLPGEYIVQAGKTLISYRGRACDFRVLAQKVHGDWEVAGIGVRVSGPNTITTHVPNGGFIADADAVLGEAFGDNASAQKERLVHMVLSCASVIDKHYQGGLGEMSMDIGMDDSGRMWFFEANAKPMKFDEPEIRKRSIEGILQHLEFLSERGR